MSFLFKSSKKSQSSLPQANRGTKSSDGPPPAQDSNGAVPRPEMRPRSPTTAGGPVQNGPMTIKPVIDRFGPRDSSEDLSFGPERQLKPMRSDPKLQARDADMAPSRIAALMPSRPAPDPSPYPWSQRQLSYTVPNIYPFPRYGPAVNAVASRDGTLYIMGGLINGSTVKGDLWSIEAGQGSMSCYPLQTTSEGPGPRVGHASLLVGNAFIVFGGDTKTEESDFLDETLYLLNTATKQWSRAAPPGPRPAGRYGHTLNILGSKIYVFGGQVEGFFFNDLVAFDLNALQQPGNQWEVLIQNTIEGGPPHGQIPPARTNHTIISWNDHLYLFGGTDGITWFNDVWAYDPKVNIWTELESIGYIPQAREGHAAALVGDVMYIFGGRTEDGMDLGDLAAFRIPSRRWYTFQNMGPSPSPRSGHTMTAIGKTIVVLAGEPSSAPRDAGELSLAYFLDTTKIKYPNDAFTSQPQTSSREISPQLTQNGFAPRSSSRNDRPSSPLVDSVVRAGSAQAQRPQDSLANRARNVASPTGEGPFNQKPQSMDLERKDTAEPLEQSVNEEIRTPVQQTQWPTAGQNGASRGSLERTSLERPSADRPSLERPFQERSSSQAERAGSRQADTIVSQVDSGLGSSPASHQREALAKQLEIERKQNTWYAAELALARKAGYTPSSPTIPTLPPQGVEDDDKQLIEAFLKTRTELQAMKSLMEEKAGSMNAKIAQIEKQRDLAINEATFAKAKLAASGPDGANGSVSATGRSDDLSKRLAIALAAQTEMTKKLEAASKQAEDEKQHRLQAEERAEASHKRLTDNDSERQRFTLELESLKAELHEAQRVAREESTKSADAIAAHKLITVDKRELEGQLESANQQHQEHTNVLVSLHEAVNASSGKASVLERQLEEERAVTGRLEAKVSQLKAELEARTSELDTQTRQLRDAEELAEKHAHEATTHRTAILAGFGRARDNSEQTRNANDERVEILQQQVQTASDLAKNHKDAADAASVKLRSAEERIAGLEAYQEQSSREGLNLRKQIQSATKDLRTLADEKAKLEQQLQSHQLEANAINVQHSALKDVLVERGINPSEIRRNRMADSPSSMHRFGAGTPDPTRLRELEQQLEASNKTQEELRGRLDEITNRDTATRREYEEKLAALDNDHQAAAKYLRGTEKMLSKMKQELQRVKQQSTEYLEELEVLRSKSSTDGSGAPPAEWETEREKLKQDLEAAKAREADIDGLKSSHETQRANLDSLRSTHETSRQDLERLQKENAALEQRATDAEQKVQLLLDRVETSVDNYRRQTTDVNGSGHEHQRTGSGSSINTAQILSGHGGGHSRGPSISRDSTYSDGNVSHPDEDTAASMTANDRNSIAINSMMTELNGLRYRLSGKFDWEQTPTKGGFNRSSNLGLTDWQRNSLHRDMSTVFESPRNSTTTHENDNHVD